MKTINFGSLNNDFVYTLEKIVSPGETLASTNYARFPGGKGLNQSIALARAGGVVLHAGYYGDGGEPLRAYLEAEGVGVEYLEKCTEQQGHALIQVDKNGQNSIIVYGGSNHALDDAYVDRVLDAIGTDVAILLQNEGNKTAYIIEQASKRGLPVFFNPSPINEEIEKVNLHAVTWLLINEIEGETLSGQKSRQEILRVLHETYPNMNIVLTLGSRGVICFANGNLYQHDSYKVKAVDTTAAGDTFTGYFIAGIIAGEPMETILENASKASAICVSGEGASPSIPTMEAVRAFGNHVE